MRAPALIALALLAACSKESPMPSVQPIRFATFNTSLNDDRSGGLIARLQAGDGNARKVAAVIQRLHPDIILLNEFDYDPKQRAARLFVREYLGISQYGQPPIDYPHVYSAPVNTGEPSGLDLNGDGRSDGPDDAWGFGRHPGQYGMLVLSRWPIDTAAMRSFRLFRWADLPGPVPPKLPGSEAPWYAPEVWSKLRLSSKAHWDLPIDTPQGRVHFLVAHPTPPVFDGPEDRNGHRNHDEIRFWAEYLGSDSSDWIYDDDGRHGGLARDAAFVLAGDMNADPDDGDSFADAIGQLLAHPRVDARFVPTSDGAAAQAGAYGLARKGDARTHTGDFGPATGTLRIDYVLPAHGTRVVGGGVFWPRPEAPEAAWLSASDHHAVWLDLYLPDHATE